MKKEKIKEESKSKNSIDEVLDMLYWLEDKHDYNETYIGKKIGELINKIQNK